MGNGVVFNQLVSSCQDQCVLTSCIDQDDYTWTQLGLHTFCKASYLENVPYTFRRLLVGHGWHILAVIRRFKDCKDKWQVVVMFVKVVRSIMRRSK